MTGPCWIIQIDTSLVDQIVKQFQSIRAANNSRTLSNSRMRLTIIYLEAFHSSCKQVRDRWLQALSSRDKRNRISCSKKTTSKTIDPLLTND